MGIIRQSTSKLFFLIYSPIYFCIMFSVVGLYFVMSYLCHRNDSNSEHKYASIFDLDRYFTTTFGDEFWERHQSVMSVLTHVNLQSWNIHIHSGDCKILKYDDIEKTGVQVGLKAIATVRSPIISQLSALLRRRFNNRCYTDIENEMDAGQNAL